MKYGWKIELPSQEHLNLMFEYKEGCLYRKELNLKDRVLLGYTETSIKALNTLNRDKAVGSLDSRGYLRFRLNGKKVLVHRVIFKMLTGEEPEFIDHVNGIRTDNFIGNLRSVDKAGNHRNSKLFKNNTSGFAGVYYKTGSWIAQIYERGKKIHIGSYSTVEEASQARRQAEMDLGYHENHGRVIEE